MSNTSNMNKSGQKPSWKSQYYEHDMRVNSGSGRRVSFKPGSKSGGNNNKKKNKDWTASIRAHLRDEDIDMGNIPSGSGKAFRKHNKGRGGRSGSPAPKFIKRKLMEIHTNWYRVTLPFGNKYEKSMVQQLLLQHVSPLMFWPFAWTTNGTIASFYVDEFKVAEKLHDLDRQIQMPDGFKFIIKVCGGSPNVVVDPEMKEKMKLAMAARYNPATKALDLSNFHRDPSLQEYFCALFKPIVFLDVIQIIVENIPDIEALNVSSNRLLMMSYFKGKYEMLPKLKIIHMGDNKIRDLKSLEGLEGFPLVEILLTGNPLCDRFKEKEEYVSEVRRMFPRLTKLDNEPLQPAIGFDISEECHFPEAIQTFLCNNEGSSIVRQFLEQYYQIFDGGNRQQLLQAYHENAAFSMTMSFPYPQRSDKNAAQLHWYVTESRNLMRVTDTERRMKLLHAGNFKIVSFLQEMPRTTHDIHTFNVDLTVFTPQMLSVTISGMFKENKGSHKNIPVRAFFRTLIIVPCGTGFCISNEMLHITNATEEQVKNFKPVPISQVIANQPVVNSSPVVAPAAIPPGIDDNTKQQMVQSMALQSGMNLDWSTRCLQDSQWDYQRAIATFSQLQKDGIIPAEAFIK